MLGGCLRTLSSITRRLMPLLVEERGRLCQAFEVGLA